MERVSIKDVRAALERYARACEAAGLVPEGAEVVLTEGSRTYGIAYRVHLKYPERGGGLKHPPAGEDFLGFTKREAWERLVDRARVLEDSFSGAVVALSPSAVWRWDSRW